MEDITSVMPASNRRQQAGFAILILCRLIHVTIFSSSVVTGFLWQDAGNQINIRCRERISGNIVSLFSSVEDKKQETTTLLVDSEEGESPAGIGGAEFFGGNKQKEELYDPIAEREAGNDIKLKSTSFNRFSVSTNSAFDSVEVASIAQTLQRQINHLLYFDDKKIK